MLTLPELSRELVREQRTTSDIFVSQERIPTDPPERSLRDPSTMASMAFDNPTAAVSFVTGVSEARVSFLPNGV